MISYCKYLLNLKNNQEINEKKCFGQISVKSENNKKKNSKNSLQREKKFQRVSNYHWHRLKEQKNRAKLRTSH